MEWVHENLEELADLRREVDTVNLKLLGLLNERAALVLALRDVKRRRGLAFHCPAREAQMLTMIQRANGGPLTHLQVERLFRTVLAVSLEVMYCRDGLGQDQR